MNAHIRDNENYLKGTAGAVLVQDALSFGVTSQMRGHRHPYANERHVETGTASNVTGGSNTNSSALTFTSAFASAPVVVCDMQFNTGTNVRAAAPSTTGFTMYFSNSTGGTLTVIGNWIAEGT